MSADGDIVREALEQARLVIPAFYPQALAALARLEAAETQLAEAERTWKNQQAITRDEMRRSDEYQDAYRAAEADLQAERETVAEWAHRVNAAEAQRDALAKALRTIIDIGETRDVEVARAALSDVGLIADSDTTTVWKS